MVFNWDKNTKKYFISNGLSLFFNMNHQFAVIVRVLQPGRDRPGVYRAARKLVPGHYFGYFRDHVASFQIEDATVEFPFDPGVKVHQGGYGTGNHEVEGLGQGLGPGVHHLHVLQAQDRCYRLCHDGLLANRIAQDKAGRWEEDGRRPYLFGDIC